MTNNGNGQHAVATEPQCTVCHRHTDELRKGLCNACRMRASRQGKAAGRGTTRASSRRVDSDERDQVVPRPLSARSKSRSVARGKPSGTPVPVLIGTLLAFMVVTAVCAVVSYSHIRHLAEVAGMDWAGWLPLPMDGLVAACSLSLFDAKQRGVPVRRLARVGIVIGLAASIAANVISVDPELVPIRWVTIVLAAYPPLVLGVSAHLVLKMLEDR